MDGDTIIKKLLPVVIVGMFLITALGSTVISEDVDDTTSSLSLFFSKPSIQVKDSYSVVSVNNMNSIEKNYGGIQVPSYVKIFTYPFKTKIDVDVDILTDEMELQYPLMPAIDAVPKIELPRVRTRIQNIIDRFLNKNLPIYSKQIIHTQPYDIYPEESYNVIKSSGLRNGERVTQVRISVPCQYLPKENKLRYPVDVQIKIDYELPEQPLNKLDGEYDMVIIAPNTFESALNPLIDHKNDKGIQTTFKSVEDILSEYDGFDAPEQIKYYIKDEIDTNDITYVLLVGGMKSIIFGTPRDDPNQGTKSWYVPARYTNLYDGGSVQDPGYLSDLYYADVYDGEGNFSTWDSNEDGIYSKWRGFGHDVMDLYPDVYLGRLPCRNKYEVNIMVDKIIAYESTKADDSWFKKIVLIGGDSHEDSYQYREGELVGDKILSYMDGFEPVKVYSSDESNPPTEQNIINAISAGSGFVVFDGHGNPIVWDTHYPDTFDSWVGGIKAQSFRKLNNGNKNPIVIIGGCHNSQYNVTLLSSITDRDGSKYTWCHGQPCIESFGWWIIRKINGGGIASIGCTGLGYGAVGGPVDYNGDGIEEPACVEALAAYAQILLFKAYNQDGIDIMGELYSEAISRYMDVFPGMSDKIDCKTVQEWGFLGDPSLKIGGYE